MTAGLLAWLLPAWLLASRAAAADESADKDSRDQDSGDQDSSDQDSGQIVVEADRSSPHVSFQALDRERVEETPGTHDDPIRLIQSLPGVAKTVEYSPSAGALAIRGAAPAESRVLLDGVELPYLYHFGEYASVIHTRLLDEVVLYPSAFSASYGDAVGGIVAIASRPSEAEQLRGGASGNAIMVGGHASTPAGPRLGVSGSGRRTVIDLIEDGNDQYTLWPGFWDYLLRVDHRGDGALSVTALGAGDRYGRLIGDTETLTPLEVSQAPELLSERAFHGLIVGTRLGGPALIAQTTAGLTHHARSASLPAEGSSTTETRLTLRHESVVLVTDRIDLVIGGEGRATGLLQQADPSRAWLELEGEDPLLVRGVTVDETLRRLDGALWVESRLKAGPTRWHPGVRSQHTSELPATAEPRLTAWWNVRPGVRLRGAGGLYSQAPGLSALSRTTGDASLTRTTSRQAAIGIDGTIARRLELAADAWGRDLTNAVVSTPGGAPTQVDGTAVGIELTARYRMRERFFCWTAVTLGRAERGDAPFDYDQPLGFDLVASWDPTERWNLGVRYRYASGLPYTPIAGGLYDGDSDSYLPIAGETNSARMPDYQKVDVHIERRWSWRRARVAAVAEGWWVPASANYLYPLWSYDYSEETLVRGLAFVPLLSFRVGF